MDNENVELVVDVPSGSSTESTETVVEFNQIDYSEQFQTIIEMQTTTNNLIAQNNVNQLFCIGCLSAFLVCSVLYNALKKFI